MRITLKELADLVQGEILRGDVSVVYDGFCGLKEARPGDISFFGNERYAKDLASTKAGVVLVGTEPVNAPEGVALILVPNAVIGFDAVVRKYAVPKPLFRPGVHPSAVLGEGVELDSDAVMIGANAVIGDGCRIGPGTRIGPCSVVGERSVIGSDCEIAANVTLREGSILGDRVVLHSGVVIGGDGYGFQFVEGQHRKIEQMGIVRLVDDVEVGANSTIDRARFGETVIGSGTKIDNLVQVAHNVIVGKHCLLVAQVGISGSTRLSDHVTVGAKAGVAGHLQLREGVMVAGGARVISDLGPGGTYFGYPAKPMKDDLRTKMHLKKLGRLFDRVAALEKQIEALQGELEGGS